MRGFWTGAEASGTAGGRQTSRDPGSPWGEIEAREGGREDWTLFSILVTVEVRSLAFLFLSLTIFH